MASALSHYQEAERKLAAADEAMDAIKHGHGVPDEDTAEYISYALWSAQVHAQLAHADVQSGQTLGVQS